MTDTYLALLAYALLAALTPLGLAATLAVIHSGRVQALAFALGVVLAQALTCAVLVGIGAKASPEGRDQRETLRALVELAVGVALLALVAAARLRPRDPAPASTVGRGHRLVERLRSLRPATALAAGVLLGVGGPKRLVLTLLAAGSIAAVDGGRSQQAWLVVAYTLVATLPAWAPIVVFELVGDRVTVALGALQRWLLRHQRELLTYLLVPLGLLMVADAVASLV